MIEVAVLVLVALAGVVILVGLARYMRRTRRRYTFEAFNADRQRRNEIRRKHSLTGRQYRKMQRALRRLEK